MIQTKGTNHQNTESAKASENTNETKKNVTKMVIITSLIFLVGNILNPIAYIHRAFFSLKSEKTFVILSLISNTLLFSSYGVNIFVYYSYNTNYRVTFKKLICKRFIVRCVSNI